MEYSSYFKLLSDETRIRILLLLLKEPLCVCQMQVITEIPQSKLSKHLAKMRDQGIVTSYQEGKFVKYELNADLFFKGILEKIANSYAENSIYAKDYHKISGATRSMKV